MPGKKVIAFDGTERCPTCDCMNNAEDLEAIDATGYPFNPTDHASEEKA